MIDSTFGYIFVIGSSIFGIAWGAFNTFLVIVFSNAFLD